VTAPHSPARARATERILVVDDEAPVRAVVRLMLERLGYRVLEAENGAEALGIVETSMGRIDLILTDLVMPDVHGGDLGECLRTSDPPRRVLYMSGYTGDEITRRGIAQNEMPLLKKPFTPDELALAVREVLDSGPSR
jgi:two-component system cell cycle sensor histidine kinase/response regulator CckA